MKFLTEFFASLTGPIGWTLLNSIWQALVVLALVVLILKIIPLKYSQVRYAAACFGLVLVVVLNSGTFIYLTAHQNVNIVQQESSSVAYPSFTKEVFSNSKDFSLQDGMFLIQNTVNAKMPLIILCWIIGASIFALRMVSGWYYLSLLKSEAVELQNEWSEKLQLLAKQLQINRIISLAESARINAPVVIGFIKPVVLVPIGMFSGLSTEQIETIFIHELAHIRRFDYIINVIQSIIESIFFFNPFVWIISKIIRREREFCCDDVVIQKHGSPLAYAHALTQLEEVRLTKSMFALALAENKNQLLNRIKRIMENSTKNYSGKDKLIPALLLVAGLICASWLTINSESPSRQDRKVLAQDTSKKEKSNSFSRISVTTLDEKGEPHTEIFENYGEGDDFAIAIPAIPSIPSIPSIPGIPSYPAMMAIPGFPAIPSIPAIPAIPSTPYGWRAPYGTFQLWSDTIPRTHFGYRDQQKWEEFREAFEEKFQKEFGDFYKTHQKDMDKMMKELQEKFADRFSTEEWSAMREQAFAQADFERAQEELEALQLPHEELTNLQEKLELEQELANVDAFNEEQQEQMELVEHQMAGQEVEMKLMEENLQEMEHQMKLFETALAKELVKDGYLGKNEEIKIMNWTDDGDIEINHKKIKASDLGKYHELHKKFFKEGDHHIRRVE